MELRKLTALELGREIKKGTCSAVEVTRLALDTIREKNRENNAFITVLEEQAMVRAAEVQKKIEKGEVTSLLAGVPFAVKDNICTKGVRTTCGSKMLSDFVPPYTATAVEKLEAAGGILLGKLNMDEFAMGSTSETSYFGPVRNPWDLSRVAGGSSGGAAAAVAAGECWYAIGTDTGGSVRQPASYCGVTGMKPTYGAVSRYGLIAYASSFDQIGPIARSAEDCAAVLDIMRGADSRDATSMEWADDSRPVKKVGLLTDCFDRVKAGLGEDAFGALQFCGVTAELCSLPLLEQALSAYYIIASAEASSNLSRYDGVKYGYRSENCRTPGQLMEQSRTEGFGAEVKRRILMGTFVLSDGYFDAYYGNAMRVREKLRRKLDELFEGYDLILLPTGLTGAPKLGESLSQPLDMYRGDCFTVIANLAGLPAVSIPWGLDENGMPMGLQIMGPRGSDGRVLGLAEKLQKVADWHERGGVG
ncbi:MAG: Asp-tRNA(Asn)/Glu-tRNA(Gln) amidotransferase subunit GatA [Oscillospiraceae bacterium]|nr:Asp-tRNA(Asn)/Glu-tRNA(Gln) amidotransferase subunit GatA [Oscillospiraceae bacterium]